MAEQNEKLLALTTHVFTATKQSTELSDLLAKKSAYLRNLEETAVGYHTENTDFAYLFSNCND